MRFQIRFAGSCLFALLLFPCSSPQAQVPDSFPVSLEWRRLVTIGSPQEERARLAELLGQADTLGFLLRSAGRMTPLEARPGGLAVELLAPEIAGSWNSEIPYSLNDAALWAGRGLSTRMLAGARARYGPVSLTLAPQLLYAQNRDFETLPDWLADRVEGRSRFASYWFRAPASIDQPHRFGETAHTTIDPGQSALTAHAGRVQLGLSTENRWWGPGLRNALVLSNNAPGFPHFFLQTDSPVRTPIGEIDAQWIAGALTESLFFDTDASNDLHALSGFAFTYRPAAEPGLTLGAARVLHAAAGSKLRVVKRAFDVFFNWEQSSQIPPATRRTFSDQILSLFGRWVFPASGAEVYAEWARRELPASFRELLTMPHHTQAYTLGLQWARPFAPGVVRVQAEMTSLEQSATFRQRPFETYYTSARVPQGYTHRGQVLGAAIGPGSSSHWVALDFLAPRWQLGAFLGRIRWETDALYLSRSPLWFRGTERSFHAYDASLLRGVRAGLRLPLGEVGVEFTRADRYNFLFQNPDLGWGPEGAVDLRNHTLRFYLSPLRP